jgi:hypothetical protein
LTLVGDDPFGYYSRSGLAYHLTGQLDEKLLYSCIYSAGIAAIKAE